jgi:hypothetical protein
MSISIHQNPHVLDYLTSRYFTGFTLKGLDDQIALSSNDGTIISILARAKFIKDEEAEQISIDVATLVAKRVAIKKAVRDLRMFYDAEAIDLTEALNTIHAFCDPDVKQRLIEGYIMYTDLPVLFPRGTEVICQTPSGALGGTVDSCNELTSMFGNYYAVTLLNMIPTNKGAALGKIVHKVSPFEAKMAVEKLGIRPITAQEKETLAERGRIFNAFTQRPTPANYTGIITIPSWFRDRVMGADGRVMVDAANFAQIDADTYHDMMRVFQIDDDGISRDGEHNLMVGDDDLWRCYNRVQGFSMRLKRWGWLDVNSLSPVIWRDNAFDQLVLDPKQKQSVLHLVRHYGSSFSDFIDGKSGGLIFLLHGGTGTGKAQPLDCMVQTPYGARRMGDMQINDLVLTPDGKNAKILGVYPQGMRPCFELTFADGRKTKADADHLWVAKTEDGRVRDERGEVHGWDIVTTKRLKDRVHRLRKSRIPVAAPIEHADADLPIDPWLLGILLGDGFYKYKQVSFSSADEYIVERVRATLPASLRLDFKGKYDYAIYIDEETLAAERKGVACREGVIFHELRRSLTALGIYGLGSTERFIPNVYMTASVEQRMELVRGLMDSDGYADKTGSINYATSSERLATDFQKLIWSLGGIAKSGMKETGYYDQLRNKFVKGAGCSTISLRVKHPSDFISLPRKKERTKYTTQYTDTFGLRIEKIEQVEDQPTQCILIDHPDHLYLTDDFIVTHNTLTAEAVAEALRRPLYAVSVGELGVTPDAMEEKLRSILDLAYQWNAVLLLDEADIFMEARDTTNVQRNAMVSIFLRQLEYYSGVMFLTTNRVATFDPAFFSRISVAINYPKLDWANRLSVWENVLTSAGVATAELDMSALAKYEVNGRNIKSAVRFAQTMAAGNARAVTQDDLVEVLGLTETFNRLIKA